MTEQQGEDDRDAEDRTGNEAWIDQHQQRHRDQPQPVTHRPLHGGAGNSSQRRRQQGAGAQAGPSVARACGAMIALVTESDSTSASAFPASSSP